MQLHQNDFWEIGHDPKVGVVTITWSANTDRMQESDFKDALERFARAGADHGAKRMLVDIRQFRFAVPETVGAWREETIVPIYNGAGVQKFAYLVGPGFPGPGVGKPPAQLAPSEDFLTSFFDDAEVATEWLTA